MKNKYERITVNTLGAYKIQSRDYIWQTGGVITIPSNAKFNSHFMVNITLDPQLAEAHATKGLGLFQTSDIRNITDDRNRLLKELLAYNGVGIAFSLMESNFS